MPGVDFVISALFETSEFRSDGDCARAPPEATTDKRIALRKILIAFTPPILLCRAEWESVKHAVHFRSSFAFFPCSRRPMGGARFAQLSGYNTADSCSRSLIHSLPVLRAIVVSNGAVLIS